MRFGIEIRRENGYNYVKIDSNDYEMVEEAIAEKFDVDTGTFGYDPRDNDRLKYALTRFFDNHSEFFDYMGVESCTEYGPTGQTFDTGGFSTFLSDSFGVSYLRYLEDEEDLQLFCDVIADKVKEALEEYEDELTAEDEDFVTKSTVSIDAEPEGTLTDPQVVDDAVIITDDGAKKIQIQDVDGAETLDDVRRQVTEDTKQVYETQVDAKVGTLKQRVESLKDKLEQQRQEMLIKGIRMVDELENWKVEDGYLKYTETIHPETVQHREKDDNPKELTEEAKEKFYVNGLKVKIRDHIRKPKADPEESYHPHVFDWGGCTGSFREDMSKEGLEKVVQQMKQIDLHRNGQNDAEQELMENLEEYIKTDEDGEEIEQEVWEV